MRSASHAAVQATSASAFTRCRLEALEEHDA